MKTRQNGPYSTKVAEAKQFCNYLRPVYHTIVSHIHNFRLNNQCKSSNVKNPTTPLSKLVPIMLAFFAMGFVDMVGTATNYAKADFTLSDTMANFLPTMVFFWFLIMSVPTSMIMNRIGKRNTVLLSLAVTSVSLIMPLVSYNFPVMLVSFCLLGIGNTLMQVSLNPLVSLITTSDKLASTLTFGQFVKAIASFITPILASWAAVKFGNWKLVFPVFAAFSILATLLLWSTKVPENITANKSAGFLQCLKLLANGTVLLLFFGIVAHVGIDVGVNTCAPKIIMERTGLPLETAGKATSVYFLFRTIGCLSGSFILAKWKDSKFFSASVAMMVLSMIGLGFGRNELILYASLAFVGFGNSNIFPIIFSRALLSRPDKTNEISGLMIMGLIGGSIFPLLMGITSDALSSQTGSVIIISTGVIYLIILSRILLKKQA